LAVRLPQLGDRPMHTDESVNAYLTGQLLAGEKYHYDPQDRHGPVLYLLAKPVAQLGGAKNFSELTESELRLTPVIVGSAIILLFGAGVEMFGFIPCLVAALLFAFAPLPVYYSRYFIHETLFAAATFGLILSGGGVLKTNSLLPAALAGLCAALMLAGKETAVIHFFALGAAGLAGWLVSSRIKIPAAKVLVTGSLVFVTTVVLLFTWGGQNWPALADLFHAIPRFAVRAGGEGHEKPFWYYIFLLAGGWSGMVLLTLSACGLARVFWRGEPPGGAAGETVSGGLRGDLCHRLMLVIYTLIIFAIYCVIPYKTPWLALNFWLPLAIFTGIAIEWLWLATQKISGRVLILVFIGTLGFLIAHDTRKNVFKIPADEINPYAYAHTGGDLLRLPPWLERLATEKNLAEPRIAVVAADAWPLPWYLRKFSHVGFWQPGQDPGPADFYITTPQTAEQMKARLENWRPEFFGARPGVLLIVWTPPEISQKNE
jgi:uncharacterized protein (TIGR03663 family)